MSPLLVGCLGIVALVALISSGVPIAFSLAGVGLLGILALKGLGIAVNAGGTLPYSAIAAYTLSAVPMFVLMGELADLAGVSAQLYRAGYNWLGRLPGGLAIATIFACAGFAATSGSSVATAATMGKISIPEMKRYGYDDKLSTGSVAAGGLLGILIPPSIPLVLYGIMTGESIGKLLLAGIVPGLLTALLFALSISLRVWANPHLAPKASGVSWSEKVNSLGAVWGVGVLFFAVIGGLYSGIVTPTEAAAVGAFAAFLMAVVKLRFRLAKLGEAFGQTARTSGMLFTILVGTALFTLFLTYAGVPAWLSKTITAIPASPLVLLIAVLFIYVPLGMFLDPMSMLLLTLPIVYPVVQALGFNGVLFGILIVKMIEIGLLTPPVGLNVFVVKGIAPEVPLDRIFAGVVWFLLVEVAIIALLIVFPEIALWLPYGALK